MTAMCWGGGGGGVGRIQWTVCDGRVLGGGGGG